MSADWCKLVETRLDQIEAHMVAIESNNATLLKIVVIGLLGIVGAVVGVKILP